MAFFFVFNLFSRRQDIVLSQAVLGGILRRVDLVEQERTRVLNTTSRVDVPGSCIHIPTPLACVTACVSDYV